jgi:hypothetical protein
MTGDTEINNDMKMTFNDGNSDKRKDQKKILPSVKCGNVLEQLNEKKEKVKSFGFCTKLN